MSAGIIDISPPVSSASPVWPGDTPFSAEPVWRVGAEGGVNVSRLVTTPHIGAHADAPLHVDPLGVAIGLVSLDPYLGPCQVLDCRAARGPVGVADVRAALARQPGTVAPRLLLRTYDTFPREWDGTFAGLLPELFDWFGLLRGGLLVGVDAASIDPVDSKRMLAHHAAAGAGVAILENLHLQHVPEGRYELIALPLRLADADASPVRAVLRNIQNSPQKSHPQE
ncbi:arylformamidase [Klugiella xanthotipulae]|uniref:Kynurenine formamidase n=1 Tax=Klugiella xanthotipulae TaxID=244735 RepID=A0A543I6J3_9MICO|nr:arylformamidase [Klugiella xanthotipulae]TQM66198.1 kynurenine formamidase [Klugiella xanthotipulae]